MRWFKVSYRFTNNPKWNTGAFVDAGHIEDLPRCAVDAARAAVQLNEPLSVVVKVGVMDIEVEDVDKN